MSTTQDLQPQHLPTRIADVGGIPIHRAIPQRTLRKVGAWCFLDHAGPADPQPPGMQVGPHPHIGLQTFTWMIRGEVLHRDSLGSEQIIRPGQVNLMTAGRGIAHSEESQEPWHIHATQLWIALPESHRHGEPRFQHYPDLPQTRVGDFTATVLAGEALGLLSPAEVHTPLMGVDLHAEQIEEGRRAQASMPLRKDFEHAVLMLSGEVQVDGQPLPEGELLYLPVGTESIALDCAQGSRLIVIGGEPMEEAIIIWWNFVARTTEEVSEAREQWEAHLRDGGGSSTSRFGKPVASPLPSTHAPSLDGVQLRASK
ncbi:pirin family protein [Diaphorobacter ruginosibacter]|uniref:Pirin family protein n=1 Tax=Diaphorobacter ruginosibacter TaxID=1715720 RepID=A0A7G9RLZ9_9BURK|nr:pirin family protein [Diaphorobacter ruginosibacter]QNN56624.1 pirin family protein [Diaphorobacter ruginosibacter]